MSIDVLQTITSRDIGIFLLSLVPLIALGLAWHYLQVLRARQLQRIRELYAFTELGRLTASLFHDISSPLTASSLALKKLTRDQTREVDHANTIKELDAALTQVLSFAQAIKHHGVRSHLSQYFSPNDSIQSASTILTPKANASRVSITFEKAVGRELQLFGDQNRFVQLITNVLSNAIDAYSNQDLEKRQVLVRATAAPTPSLASELATNVTKMSFTSKCSSLARTSPKTTSSTTTELVILITVQDWGCGIHPSHFKKMLTPFFSTKSAGRGTGIGLDTVHRIAVKEFNGSLWCWSEVGIGSIFSVALPAHRSVDASHQK